MDVLIVTIANEGREETAYSGWLRDDGLGVRVRNAFLVRGLWELVCKIVDAWIVGGHYSYFFVG